MSTLDRLDAYINTTTTKVDSIEAHYNEELFTLMFNRVELINIYEYCQKMANRLDNARAIVVNRILPAARQPNDN